MIEMEIIWKEAFMVQPRYYLGICLEGLRKTTGYPVSHPIFERSIYRVEV
jgi:hypothetical protein